MFLFVKGFVFREMLLAWYSSCVLSGSCKAGSESQGTPSSACMWMTGKNSPIYLVLLGCFLKGIVILCGSFWSCYLCHVLKL